MLALGQKLLTLLLSDADDVASINVPARWSRISFSDERLINWRCLSPDEQRSLACELMDLAAESGGVLEVQIRRDGTGTASIEIERREWLRETLRPTRTHNLSLKQVA